MQAPVWKQHLDSLRITDLAEVFGRPKPIIGMVHLWPMPGAPAYQGGGMQAIIDAALADAESLAEGGVDGLIVENMWDIPFRAGSDLPPESIAAHAVAARAVAQSTRLPMGVNLVHNGGLALLAVAIAAGADFMRVCMFTGAGVWDGGHIDQGCAAELMRRRRDLQAEHIKILADVDKKHSVRFPGIDLATHMEWTRFFGADALILSGRMTGDSPGLEKLRQARALCPDRPLLVGSGANEDNVADMLGIIDGIIVGSSIKVDGQIHMPVDADRVRRLVAAARA